MVVVVVVVVVVMFGGVGELEKEEEVVLGWLEWRNLWRRWGILEKMEFVMVMGLVEIGGDGVMVGVDGGGEGWWGNGGCGGGGLGGAGGGGGDGGGGGGVDA